MTIPSADGSRIQPCSVDEVRARVAEAGSRRSASYRAASRPPGTAYRRPWLVEWKSRVDLDRYVAPGALVRRACLEGASLWVETWDGGAAQIAMECVVPERVDGWLGRRCRAISAAPFSPESRGFVFDRRWAKGFCAALERAMAERE